MPEGSAVLAVDVAVVACCARRLGLEAAQLELCVLLDQFA